MHVRKPRFNKHSALSSVNMDEPVKMGQKEIPSDMGRTRHGIHRSTQAWGNRTWGGDKKHPNAKPC